jgi:hypothetical protein
MRPNPLCSAVALASLALLSVACGTDSLDPVQPNLAANVQTFLLEEDLTFNPLNCAPEQIAFHLRTAFRLQSVVAGDGRRFIQSIQITDRGSIGVGVETGTVYRLNGGHHEVFSTGENGTNTIVSFQKYVSQGSAANFTGRLQAHFTMTPDGEIVRDFTRFEPGC